MTLPTSTYRLQFRNGMDFARAEKLVPYLRDLGISHLYASPLMTAVTGSTHGYDVTDANEIDPTLGGLEGLRALSGTLKAHGLGLILDIVPNHMAASLENRWWRNVIAEGQDSPNAHYFDIDWSERLTLPFLGKSFEEELADGAITLARDPSDGRPALRYYDAFYPLNEATVRELDQDRNFSGDPATIARIHDAQSYRLTDWKTAGKHLSYRRFFEIAGLVGLRVEDAAVLEDSHRLILDLVRNGTLDGLRLDHIDGLADPAGYLDRLRQAVGPDTYIVVEKILEKSEPLPAEWPIEGATGYEFIAALADAMTDETGAEHLKSAFRPLKREDHRGSYEAERTASKRQMLEINFAGEVERVTKLAKVMADAEGLPLTSEALAEAIRATIVALPVYRTYATRDGCSESDCEIVAKACKKAETTANPEAVAFIARLLTENDLASALPQVAEFRPRFQQLSGPIMAKALEDTLFYRENAFIAANEVGGDPGAPSGGVPAFHAAMQERQRATPKALSATSTHDTKRGEDARARLYTLSEASETWIAAYERWREANGTLRVENDSRTVPEPDVEWLIYQALAGAWPLDGLADRTAKAAFRGRMELYIEKALREAKIGSDWGQPDTEYEGTVKAFVDGLLMNDAFVGDFERTLAPFVQACLINALSQTLLKLTAPGIPDVYQGSECADFSLVDPDNRPLLDVESLAVPDQPAPSTANFRAYKQWLIAKVLKLRADHRDLFEAPYKPLTTSDEGAHAIAFLRGTAEHFALTVVPRKAFGRTRPDHLLLSPETMRGITISVPQEIVGRPVRSVIDGRTFKLGAEVPLSDVVANAPVALLLSDED